MKGLVDVLFLITLTTATNAAFTVPDSVSYRSTRLVYYKKKATWYQADRLCRANGGFLVLVDSQAAHERLLELSISIGSMSDIHTRMVRHDDKLFYTHDHACKRVDTSGWKWEKPDHAMWHENEQCVLARGSNFEWKKNRCDHEDEYVCEYSHALCDFQGRNVSLATVPTNVSSQARCQEICRTMMGCFASAPSSHTTIPPFNHCIVAVTGDVTNTLATLDKCQSDTYEIDDVADAKADFTNPPHNTDPTNDPIDCVPQQQDLLKPLADFLQEDIIPAVCSSSDVVTQTAYLTVTPDVITTTVTQSPLLVTDYVTISQPTDYVTVTQPAKTIYLQQPPHIHTSYITVQAPVHTNYVTVTPSTVAKTEVVTYTVSASCFPHTNQATGSPDVILSTAPLTRTVTQFDTVVVTSTVVTTMATHMIHTATVSVTATIPGLQPSTLLCPPSSSVLPKLSSCPTDSTSTVAANETKEEMLEKLQSVVRELKVNPLNVSKSRRKKESALDDRPSAQTMGFTASLLLIVIPVIIVLHDAPALLWEAHRSFRLYCASNDNTPP